MNRKSVYQLSARQILLLAFASALIAVGATTSNGKSGKQEVITFLIPAEMGKLHSGSKAMVELATVGKLGMARYNVN